MSEPKALKDFYFTIAKPEDNKEIIEHVKNNPINMEIDYIMDRQDDFFKIQKILTGSKVYIARDANTNEIAACLSLLKLEGKIANLKVSYQYITDLVKDPKKGSPLLMQQLLNFTFRNYFNTDFVFGLINAENKKARMFSSSKNLEYKGSVTAKFNYYEIIPLLKHRIPKRIKFQFPSSQETLKLALEFINDHYKNHLLFHPLDMPYVELMFENLPNFSYENIVMAFEGEQLKGVMIIYNPSEIVSLIIAKMDKKTRMLVGILKVINSWTGLLFSPPETGEKIKTLQVRYLAGTKEYQSILLRYANNFAYSNKLHTISMLVDEREQINIRNKVVYQYKSLMYAGFKKRFLSNMHLFKEKPVFVDITFS